MRHIALGLVLFLRTRSIGDSYSSIYGLLDMVLCRGRGEPINSMHYTKRMHLGGSAVETHEKVVLVRSGKGFQFFFKPCRQCLVLVNLAHVLRIDGGRHLQAQGLGGKATLLGKL